MPRNFIISENLFVIAFPDNDDYEVSWVEFKTEQLENFNWNRMDFYVCTRGDKVSSHDFFNFLLRAKND